MRPVRDVPGIAEINLRALAFVCGEGCQNSIPRRTGVLAPFTGQVFVAGELWQAHRADGADLTPGDHVQVEAVDGLELTVR